MSVDLLSDQDYLTLKQLAKSKAEEIAYTLFKDKVRIELSFLITAVEALNLKWIMKPDLICMHLLEEAGI